MQKTILCICKALTPIIMLINDIGTGQSEKPLHQLLDPLNDAKRLLVAAINFGNHARKEMVRSILRDPRFIPLCSWDTPVGKEELFGPEFLKQFQEVDDTSNKLGRLLEENRRKKRKRPQGQAYQRKRYG